MTTLDALKEHVRRVWKAVPAPPVEDLDLMTWGWGDTAYRAFVGVAPLDVDRASAGFFAATPLLDLPPRAAAAYLGTFVMSLLENLELQQALGVFPDVVTRAHTLSTLRQPQFWEDVVRPHLSPDQRDALAEVVRYLASERGLLALSAEHADEMVALASA